MKNQLLLDMAGLTQTCPACGEFVNYELKTMSDFAVCKHCGIEFELSDESKQARDAFFALIQADGD